MNIGGRVRHTSGTVYRAKLLADGGWERHEIRRLLAADGIDVSPTTLRRWLDPEYAERRKAQQAKTMYDLRHKSRARYARRNFRPETRLLRMRELAEVNVPAGSIAKVMELDFGMSISAEQVRYSLKTGSLPRSARVEVGGRG